jgi:UDPglucose 6-dehydrogenase
LGQSPIYEPGREELIALAHKRGGLNFGTDLIAVVRESEIIFIAVGTPPLPSGEANLVHLEMVARGIAPQWIHRDFVSW